MTYDHRRRNRNLRRLALVRARAHVRVLGEDRAEEGQVTVATLIEVLKQHLNYE